MANIYPKVMDIMWRYDGDNNSYITYMNPKSNSIHILNPVAAKIFELCTGNNSQMSIVDSIYDEFSVPTKEIIVSDVNDFLEYMSKDGIIQLLSD